MGLGGAPAVPLPCLIRSLNRNPTCVQAPKMKEMPPGPLLPYIEVLMTHVNSESQLGTGPLIQPHL